MTLLQELQAVQEALSKSASICKMLFTERQKGVIPAGADESGGGDLPGPSTLRICSPDGGLGGTAGARAGASCGLTAGGTPMPGAAPAAGVGVDVAFAWFTPGPLTSRIVTSPGADGGGGGEDEGGGLAELAAGVVKAGAELTLPTRLLIMGRF